MLLFLIYLIPILLAGIIILGKISRIERVELLLPAGSIVGFAGFTFFLNMTAFLVKGSSGITLAYVLFIALGFIIFKFIKSEKIKIIFPRGGNLIFWLSGILIWGPFIFWKTANALIGSDANLYYAIAHSFIKGNFPFMTPWQPDIPLSYHTGVSELLGAFYYFSGLDFQFLHLFFSALFIFCALQIIIWIFKEKHNFISFLLSNLAVAVTFLSFGFIYIIWPVLPVRLPEIQNINQLILWLRTLPSVNEAIEVYGAPINLDSLIYFIFHAFGLAIFLTLVTLLINQNRKKPLWGWVIICLGLGSLALVNEALFIAAFPALIVGIFLIEYREKKLLKNLKKLLLLFLLTGLVIFFQGGVISASINSPRNLEESALILPKKEDIKEDFKGYHSGQETSKLLPVSKQYLPLRWFHIGADILLLLSIVIVWIFNDSVLFKVLFISGLSSFVAYNVIVPKFLVANGNRFLSASFLFFSLLLCLSLTAFFEKIKKHHFFKILFLVIIAWVFLPTILPPLALLSKTRFGENKLIPKYQQSSVGIRWLKDYADFNERVLVLDRNAPHPSGQVRALVGAGVFAPVFSGNFRAFTIEASPEYVDAAYYLSPNALKKLKMNILLIDNVFFETLPQIRKDQLKNSKYFEKVFGEKNGEIIYRIKNEYLEKGGEIDGTIEQMAELLPAIGKVYIDGEDSYSPSYLRRPLIFILRDKDIYYLPQSGVYLNVETNINSHTPLTDGSYDYLVLGKKTNPYNLCTCQAKLVWTGLKGQVFLWKAIR